MLALFFLGLVAMLIVIVVSGIITEWLRLLFRAFCPNRDPIVQPAKVWIKVDGHTRNVFEHDLKTMRDNGLVFTVEPRKGN